MSKATAIIAFVVGAAGGAAAAWAMSLSEVLLFVLCLFSLYRINKRV